MVTILTKAQRALVEKHKVGLFKALKRRGVEHDCEHGHEGCSAWDGGPCAKDILVMNVSRN